MELLIAKRKNLKTARKKKHITCRETKIRMTVNIP